MKLKRNNRLTLTMYSIFVGLLALAATIESTAVILARSDHQAQLTAVKGELGYKKRSNNRYEGFYEKSTGGSLDVASLLYGKLHFHWHPTVVLEVRLHDHMKNPVNVRARAIPLKTYYQMDAGISPRETLKWPINDVIYKAGLKPSMIGVFGWIGSEREKKFVPLKVVQQGTIPTNDNRIFLMVRADVDVEKVICRFSDIVDGKNVKSKRGWNVIGDYINAGHAITIELPARNPGELCVEIKAKPAHGGTWLPLKITVVYGKIP